MMQEWMSTPQGYMDMQVHKVVEEIVWSFLSDAYQWIKYLWCDNYLSVTTEALLWHIHSLTLHVYSTSSNLGAFDMDRWPEFVWF